jgi:hypothetical protein
MIVINSTNINKTKESLNSDGHQFHQYQQNKRKFKQWWSSIPPISIKQTIITLILNWLYIILSYDIVYTVYTTFDGKHFLQNGIQEYKE